jgi:hypothetical protein
VPELTQFEGLDVDEVGIEIPNAAGGLQDAMKFDPVEWHHGDEHFIVLRCEVKKVRVEPIVKDDFNGPQRRVHVMHVDQAAPIEGKAVQKQLAAYQERIQKAKEKAEGVTRIPGIDGESEEGFEYPNPDGDGATSADDLPIGDDTE